MQTTGTTREYVVEGMTCGHCVQTIEKAVKSVDPRAEVTVDLTAHEVMVRTETEEAHIAAAIHSAGYENRRLPT
jgi:copper chaperone